MRPTTTPDPTTIPEPVLWQWVLDQRGDRRPGPARTTPVGDHTRPLLERPINLVRQLPSLQLDAAPRRRSTDDDIDVVEDGSEAGQATAEYALVLLGAAAISLLVVSWATKTNLVGK